MLSTCANPNVSSYEALSYTGAPLPQVKAPHQKGTIFLFEQSCGGFFSTNGTEHHESRFRLTQYVSTKTVFLLNILERL